MQDYANGDIDQGPQTLHIGWTGRPNNGDGPAIQITDYAGPGWYVVRNASGAGPSRTMSGTTITARYTHDATVQAF